MTAPAQVRAGHTPGEVGHAPVPWIQIPHPDPNCGCIAIGAEGDDFATAHTSCYLNTAANAALIVRAVNSHAALVEALKLALQGLEIAAETSPERNDEAWIGYVLSHDKARAAVAAACGEKL